MSNTIFTGASQFAVDLQSVITRSVAIASMPIKLLEINKTSLDDQSTAVTNLQTCFKTLQDSVGKISAALGEGSYEAQVSNEDVALPTLSSGAAEGNYSIDVLDVGAYATSLTTTSWAQTSGPHTYQLAIGADKFDVLPSDDSAAGVAAAINLKSGDKVRATVVNVGSGEAPDYRISLQNLTLGNTPVDILDGGVSLQTQKTEGRKSQYIVNNSGVTVSSNSRSVNIAAGLTVTLLSSDPGHITDITVTRSTSSLASALSGFADAYNSAAAALDAHRGSAGGALSGQSLVYDLQNTLSSLSTFASSTSLAGGLEDLGLTVDLAGTMTFNPYKLMATDLTNAAGLMSFLESPNGLGYLSVASAALDSVLNSERGMLTGAGGVLTSQIADLDGQISERQEKVDELEARLLEQMAAADAAIAAMEQRYMYVTNLFSAMRSNSESYD